MIEVRNLVKCYGDFTAVDDLSFEIEPGHIYGLLGANGAGKTTTMNIITGCLAATGGTVKIGGHDIFEEPVAAKKLIGYLPEQPPLYQDMLVDEYLRFVAKAKGVAKAAIDAELKRVADATGLNKVRTPLIKHLSKGYKQRVGIAQAILANPEVIILDEPTVGLDPLQIVDIRKLIKSLAQEHTVILSSHILSEIEEVCDRLLILSHGKLAADDTTANLTGGEAGESLEAVFMELVGTSETEAKPSDTEEGAEQ